MTISTPHSTPIFNLLLKGGRAIDPASSRDGLFDVAVADGKIAAVDANIPATAARQTVDVTGLIVTPGLIDMHTHVYTLPMSSPSSFPSSTARARYMITCGRLAGAG